MLHLLELSVQGLDDKAYFLLGITDGEKHSVLATRALYIESLNDAFPYKRHRPKLPQVSSLQFCFHSW